MSSIKIDTSELARAIADAISEYSQDVTDAVKDEVKRSAAEAVSELGETSPKGVSRRKPYRKGWKAEVSYESDKDIRITVHNKNKPGLTHLLENGHAKVNGGRVEGIPHIAPVEEKLKQTLANKIKTRLR